MSFRYIQSTCATSGEGLYEGLDWLSNNIANKVINMCVFCFLFFITIYDSYIVHILTCYFTSCAISGVMDCQVRWAGFAISIWFMYYY